MNIIKKINWKMLLGVPTIGLLYLFVVSYMAYIAISYAPYISEKINFYWWVQMFKNQKLSFFEFYIYNNVYLITYILTYVFFFMVLIMNIFLKEKTVLSLCFVIFISQIAMLSGEVFSLGNGHTDFQYIYISIQKYATMFLIGLFMYQTFSPWWKKKTE